MQNLTMFGIDIVVEKGTGHHVVIDINYFPGKSVFPCNLLHLQSK